MLILTPSDPTLATANGPAAQLAWVRTANGQHGGEHGVCAASLLPAETEVVLVLPVLAVSWHRVALPRVAGGRLRNALEGLLEDRLLGDASDLHFALEPGGRPGQTLWIAACDKAWLRSWLRALDAAGRPVSRIVPGLWPHTGIEPLHQAHVVGGRAWLSTASEQGVRSLPLDAAGTVVTTAEAGRWQADPVVAEQAEQALDRRFEPVPLHEWMLQSARSDWNLAQFDLSLSRSARRGQRVRRALRELVGSPAWRPARWGMASLLASLLLGLNTAAWQERNSLGDKRAAVRQTLQQTFPQVTLVLDPPLQMERELQRLQVASGQLGPHDLEAMLSALGQNIPAIQPTRLTYSRGELRLQGPVEQLTGLAGAVPAQAWQADVQGDTLALRPREPGAAP
ncbi:MAG: type II secretion system protein GspL [Hydrogenophaga sp.]